MRGYFIMPPCMFAIFLAFILDAYLLAPEWWNPLEDDLSTLGAQWCLSGGLFIAGCITAGLMLLSYGLAIHRDMEGLYSRAGICFAVAGASLIAVGAVIKDFWIGHTIACYSLAISMGAGLFLTALAEKEDKLLMAAGAVLLIITAVLTPFYIGCAVGELIPLIAACVWCSLLAWKHIDECDDETFFIRRKKEGTE